MCHWINKQPSSICLNWVNIIPCCVCVLYLAFYLFMAEFLLLSFHLIPLFLLIAVLRTALQSKSLFHCYYLRAFWRNGRFRLPTHVLCVCVCVCCWQTSTFSFNCYENFGRFIHSIAIIQYNSHCRMFACAHQAPKMRECEAKIESRRKKE